MKRDLDDIKGIERIDQAGMRRILLEFPRQMRQAFTLGKDFSLAQNYQGLKNIVFCGMGGSAIGAEVIGCFLRKEITLSITVNRDYGLPEFVDSQTLVILTSYSGNTEETRSAYQKAQEKQAKIIVISSGGKLIELAKNDRHPFLLIPKGFPPRAALGYVCLPPLAIFSQMGLIADKSKEVDEAASLLERLEKDSLGIAVSEKSNPAKRLAGKIYGKFCVIYAASEHLGAVAWRFRGQLAENSKTLSSSHLLPEMNHNEIVGWQHPKGLLKNFVAIFLRDKADHPQVKKRIEISRDILQKENISVEEIASKGEGLLARMFSLIYTADFVSFYLAILNGEDPTPVKRIDYLKKRLKED